MSKYIKHILIILFVSILFILLGAKCPWEKDEDDSGSSGPGPTDPYIGGTWAWDGANWALLTPANEPPPRGGHAMAYDSARQRIVLFGGSGSGSYEGSVDGYYNDTWEWDGTNWLQRYSTVTPSVRTNHAMAYDSARQKTVLFGGKWGGGAKRTKE